jgi:hypothetical protein
MKIFTNILVLLAVALIIFTLLDYRNPFQGDSVVAFIGCSLYVCCFDSFNFKTAKRLKRNQMSNCNRFVLLITQAF